MMRKTSPTLALLLIVLVPILVLGTGASRAEGPVKLLTTIPVPVRAANPTGGLYSFDISFVDQATQTYYLADRSNAVVDVCLLYTSPSPRDRQKSRMPSSA